MIKFSDLIKPDLAINNYTDKFSLTEERHKELCIQINESGKKQTQNLKEIADRLSQEDKNMFMGNPLVFSAYLLQDLEVNNTSEALFALDKVFNIWYDKLSGAGDVEPSITNAITELLTNLLKKENKKEEESI